MMRLYRVTGFWFFSILVLIPGFLQAQDVGLSGRIYTGYYYNTHTNFNAFYLDRVYLGYAGELTSDVDFTVTSDIGPDLTDGGYQLLMKYAFISWEQGESGGLSLGMIPMNAFDVQKKTWGYRYLRKTVMNDRKFAPSADLGVGYDLRFSRKFSLSTVISNGAGYKNPETNEFKRVHIRLLYGPDNLGKSRGLNLGTYASVEPQPAEQSRYTFAGFSGLHVSDFWVGTELAYQVLTDSDWQHILYSLYSRLEVGESATAFGRIDYSDEEALVAGGTTHFIEKMLIGGVEFVPAAGIKIAPHFVYLLEDDGEDSLELRLGTEFRW